MRPTKTILLDAGLELLLQRGYNDLGIQTLLKQTDTPKGSFYHHFASKEDFSLQVIDQYMVELHAGLNACLEDENTPPLDRIRNFFEATRDKYGQDGFLGCMLGGLGQELSGVSDTFRLKIDDCLSTIGGAVAVCLHEAKVQGQLQEDADPDALARLLINCWEGAALRSRLLRSPEPLDAMLDFYFGMALAQS